jgi:hypothetical protein
MHTVIETSAFSRSAKAAGLSEEDRLSIATFVSESPLAGDAIPGTGGARKFRYAAPGRGKRGGYRVVTFYAAEDVPVFLLDIFAKGERVDLSQAERNALRETLGSLADDYRASTKQGAIDRGAR